MAVHAMNVQDPCSSFGTGFVAPALMLDVGILIGRTPGTKFFLGVSSWFDAAPTLYVGPDLNYSPTMLYPGRAMLAASGTEVFLLPTIGFQFGH